MNKITCVLLAIILLSSFAMKLRSEIQSTATGDLTKAQTNCLETCATQFASNSRIQTEFLGWIFKKAGAIINPIINKVGNAIGKVVERGAQIVMKRTQIDDEDGGNDEDLEEEEVLVAFYCSGKCGIEF